MYKGVIRKHKVQKYGRILHITSAEKLYDIAHTIKYEFVFLKCLGATHGNGYIWDKVKTLYF